MSGIIIELQSAAIQTDIRISDLLRKALLVAKKLNRTEIETWILSELNGYKEGAKIPEYRRVRGQIKAFNNYNGCWIPVIFPKKSKTEKILSSRACNQSVSELESLINDNPENIGMPFNHDTQASLMKAADIPFPPVLIVSITVLYRILDSVKTKILEWALTLEEEGVIGENLSFSQQEKIAASNVTINIENMNSSQIQAGTTNSNQTMEIEIDKVKIFNEKLDAEIDKLSLEKDNLDELKSEILTLKAQTKSPKPKTSIIKSSMASIKTILESAAGNVTAQSLLTALSRLSGL